jgi:hypothetical protein
MANLDDDDLVPIVIDFVEDSIRALADSIPFLSGELLAPFTSGLVGEGANALQDAGRVSLGDRTQVLGDRFLEEQAISCHGA